MNSAVEDKEAVRGVLDRWKSAVDAHEPERVAALFTEDAIFQGLHPYSVGRAGIAEYYDSLPVGMTTEYRILETRRPAESLVLAYVSVDFSFPDRPTLTVYLGALVELSPDGGRIRHYQVSRLG